MIKQSTKKPEKKPTRRYVRKITYYVYVEGAKATDELPPQPRTMVETIKGYGRVERSILLKDLEKRLDTKQPIARLFSFHKSQLIKAKFFKEVKEPVVSPVAVAATPEVATVFTPPVGPAEPVLPTATASVAVEVTGSVAS